MILFQAMGSNSKILKINVCDVIPFELYSQSVPHNHYKEPGSGLRHHSATWTLLAPS